MSFCTFNDHTLNYPGWLSTAKGFPNAVIMAHSNSINQQAKAITASMDFDYWLYALMTSNPSPADYFTQLERGKKKNIRCSKFIVTAAFICLLEQICPVDLRLCDNGPHGVALFFFRFWLMDEAFCVLPSGALLMREPFYHCISSPEEYKESQVRLDIIGQPEHLTVK